MATQTVATGDTEALDADTVAATLDAPNSDSELATSDGSASEQDEEAASAAYDAAVERQLDDAYESYLQRRHARDAIKAEKRKRTRLSEAGATQTI